MLTSSVGGISAARVYPFMRVFCVCVRRSRGVLAYSQRPSQERLCSLTVVVPYLTLPGQLHGLSGQFHSLTLPGLPDFPENPDFPDFPELSCY